MNLQTQMSLIDPINTQQDSEEEETREGEFFSPKISPASNSRVNAIIPGY